MTEEKKVGEKEEITTVEIEEEVESETPELPTEEQLREDGMSAQEIEMVKKHDLLPGVKKEGDKKPEEKKESKAEEPNKEAEEKKLLEITDKNKKGEGLTPEEETILIPSLDKRGQAFYFQMKNDRRRRQDAENERDLLRVKLKAAEKKEPEPKKEKEDEEAIDDDKEIADLFEEDENKKDKKKIDDKDKPLTKGDLEDIEKEKEAKVEAGRVEARKMNENNTRLETEARAKDPDNFDYILFLAREMFNDPDFGDSYSAKVVMAAANPDAPEGKTAVDAIYAVAKKHPDYKENGGVAWKAGQKTRGEKKSEEKEEFKRIVKNAGKISSAALGGGGKKVVALEDLNLEQASRLPQGEWNKLPHEVRQRILKE